MGGDVVDGRGKKNGKVSGAAGESVTVVVRGEMYESVPVTGARHVRRRPDTSKH